MTGPEHYREAERLLAVAASSDQTTYEGANPEADRTIAEAQVHATLALAAATAMSGTQNGMARVDFNAWGAVAGVPLEEDGDA
ncbi:hypothetical protein ACFW34_11840 [Streptomyces sp. NPDC058848]|uniref:hypothetical protein n=1 Tax=unclassified Streptomyces TaxID=2593676 RepID=UPI0036A020A8